MAEEIYNGSVGCLENVSRTSKTREVLQQLIIQFCESLNDFNSLNISLPETYVSYEQFSTEIKNYLDSIAAETSEITSKMIPFISYPYFGPINVFDNTGAGTGIWERVYLCNGQNGTPDLRGRTLVGATSMGTDTFPKTTDPALPGNPTYSVNTLRGSNSVVLSKEEIPSHTHTTSVTVAEEEHSHNLFNDKTSITSNEGNDLSTNNSAQAGFTTNDNYSYGIKGSSNPASLGNSEAVKTNIEVNVTNAMTGGGQAHSNIQPSCGTNYIMYIPPVDIIEA